MITIRSKEEILSARARKYNEDIGILTGVFVIPNNNEHDSGWMCMGFVAEPKDETKPLVKFGGGCDSVSFEGTNFKMDCTYPDGIIHIWNRQGFQVSNDCSSIFFSENPWWK